MNCPWTEFRGWLQLLVFIVGGGIALRTYIVSQRQLRLENSLKLLDIFFYNLEKDDIDEWKDVFRGAYSAEPGYFYSKSGIQIPLKDLFAEGPADNGATDRIVQQIDLISYQALKGTVDVQFVYSQLGQLIDHTHRWYGENSSFIENHYPHFYKLHRKYRKQFKKWPKKVFTYIE